MKRLVKDIELTVIVPIFNEINYIEELAGSIFKNDYNSDRMEVLFLDGGSDDGTREYLESLCLKVEHFFFLDNPQKRQVYALNLGLKESRGKYIVRCDAHAKYPTNYFSFLVNELKKAKGLVNIGVNSIAKVRSKSLTAQIISFLLSSKFGVGSSHRVPNFHSKKIEEVDTVLFGAWEKRLFNEIGLFDTNFIRGQDYEHNLRLRLSGGKVIVMREISFEYYVREAYGKFCRMMFQYAYAKPCIAKKYKFFPNVRSLVPIMFFITLFFSFIFYLKLFICLLVFYLVFSFFAAIEFYRIKKNIIGSCLVPIFLVSQHASHALGFLFGWFSSYILRKKTIDFEHTR